MYREQSMTRFLTIKGSSKFVQGPGGQSVANQLPTAVPLSTASSVSNKMALEARLLDVIRHPGSDNNSTGIARRVLGRTQNPGYMQFLATGFRLAGITNGYSRTYKRQPV
jgi:hypothetical protein